MASLLPPDRGMHLSPQRSPALRAMGWHVLSRRLVALALATMFLAVGCGGTVFVASTGGRLLVFVSVTPASIDPALSNGQVFFTAAGTFNSSPTIVSPLPGVIWTVDHPAFGGFPDLGRASITQDGLAQCGVGFVGTVTVFATAAADSTVAVSQQNQRVGTATLVCP